MATGVIYDNQTYVGDEGLHRLCHARPYILRFDAEATNLTVKS